MLGCVRGEGQRVDASMAAQNVCLNPVKVIYRHALTAAREVVAYPSY